MKKVKNILAAVVAIVLAPIFCAACHASTSADSSPAADNHESATDSFAVAMNPSREYLIIVNDDYPYRFGDAYDEALQSDIIYVADCYGEPTPVEKAAYLAFSELAADLHAQGIQIALYSAYRTESDQQWVYDHYANLKNWDDTNTVKEPGYSEHHTGLMIEFVVWYNGGDDSAEWTWYTVTAERATDPYYQPIWSTLAKYGFIERYPAGKEDITGVTYEPYELRFVGSSAVATEIAAQGICLEEYAQK